MKTLILAVGSLIFSVTGNAFEAKIYETLTCKATGKVSGITLIQMQNLGARTCGFVQTESKTSTVCFDGTIFNQDQVLSSATAVMNGLPGELRTEIRHSDTRGYWLTQIFECSDEEKCLPGHEETLVWEALECRLAQLKY